MKEALVRPHQERIRQARAQAAGMPSVGHTTPRPRQRQLARPARLLVTLVVLVMLFAGVMTRSVDARPVAGWGIDNTNPCLETHGGPFVLESGDAVMSVCLLDGGPS